MDLVGLLKHPEGKTLEYKRDLSSPLGVLRSAVAFANTAGGIVLIGVEDRSAHVRGVTEPFQLEERLANLLSDSIHPRLVPELEILPWRNKYVLGLQVFPSASRPHYLKREGPIQGTYVRVGSTNRRADPELIGELERFARGRTFDEEPMPALNSEAIDFRVASELFAPVRKLRRADLETLRIVTEHQGQLVPTVGGVLLFGATRERHFPDAWIQVGRFAGSDRSRILDHTELRANPVQAIEDAIAFVHKHLNHAADIGAVRRVERWTVPPVVIREAVINAVVHADFSQTGAPVRVSIFDDRIEVENPGLLPFGLTIDDLERGVSKLRNRVIGRVFHDLGLIERWGSGITRMRAACHEAGLPSPVFEEVATRFRVTLATKPSERPAAAEAVDQRILDVLADGEGRLTSELAAAIDLTTRATRTRLIRLVGTGRIREIGSGPQDPQRRYYLAGP